MTKTYTSREAAAKIGISFPTIHRWLKAGLIKPQGIELAGRTMWVWTDADIAAGRKLKGTQNPGPKPKKGGKK